MKGRELIDRVVTIEKKIEELFFKLITVSIDDMDKFKHKEMKKKRHVKNILYDCLINYIPKPTRKIVDGFIDKVKSYFKTNAL